MANVNRALQPQEFELIDWMLGEGCPHGESYREQLRAAQVCGKCDCGCASINLKVHDHEPDYSTGREILADYLWRDGGGNLMGASVYAHQHQLAGLEVWSVDGGAIPTELPHHAVLLPYEQVCCA